MNVTLRIPTTVDEFLAWEERQALRTRLGAGFMVFGSDVKLRMPRTVRYPDAMIVAGPVAHDAKFVTDPVVVFDVLSESTSRTDRLLKSQEYGAVPSVARYVIVEQAGIGATVFARPDWRGQPLTGADSVLGFPELGTELRLGAFCQGLAFPPDAT